MMLVRRQDEMDYLQPRARQNVIFEFGYFWGRLGRKRLCVLYDLKRSPVAVRYELHSLCANGQFRWLETEIS